MAPPFKNPRYVTECIINIIPQDVKNVNKIRFLGHRRCSILAGSCSIQNDP